MGYNNTTRREVVGQVVDYLGVATLRDPSESINGALEKQLPRPWHHISTVIGAAFDGRLSPAAPVS